jgi:hypothetical protein
VTPTVSAPPTLTWTTLTEPDIRPKRGFEHSFLVSDRGTMIQIRHLEGELTTIVASTRDGVAWTTDEVPSDTVPAGQAVNGGADWMQLVARKNGQLQLVASADGFAWDERGVLPEVISQPWASAVNGTAIVVCGSATGPSDATTECALSADDGSTWTHLADLGPTIGPNPIRGIVPLGTGFLMIIEGEADGESVAFTSTDGTTWIRQAAAVPNRATAVGVIGGVAVAYGAVGGADGEQASIVTSRDGVTWEVGDVPVVQGGVREFLRAGDVLVAPVLWNQPEGAEFARDVLLSADGRTWVAGGIPAGLGEWQSPTFLPVEDAVIALGGEQSTILVGRVTAPAP